MVSLLGLGFNSQHLHVMPPQLNGYNLGFLILYSLFESGWGYIKKKDIIEELNNVCAICGCSQEHNGKPLVFVLDHIDGDASNNRRENLRCLCPNCDSQLDTYKSKNKKRNELFGVMVKLAITQPLQGCIPESYSGDSTV